MRESKRLVGMIGIIFVIGLSLTVSPKIGEAVEFPTKPITLINPNAVGGGVDIAARALAKEIEKILGSPVVVESRTGGAGLIAGYYVAKSKPDGYTLGILTGSEFAPEFYECIRKPMYTSKDFEPVIRWMNLPYGIVSRTGRPWKSLPEFIKYAKENPNKVKLGHIGVGTPYHVCFYYLAKQNNLKVVEIPYAGAGPITIALAGGHVDVGTSSISAVQGFIQEGRMRMLALHNHARFPGFTEVPTFQELGHVPGYTYNIKGMWVSKGTAEAIKKKLHDVIKQAIETPSFKAFAKEKLFDPYYGSPEDLKAEIKAEEEVVAPLIQEVCEKYKP